MIVFSKTDIKAETRQYTKIETVCSLQKLAKTAIETIYNLSIKSLACTVVADRT